MRATNCHYPRPQTAEIIGAPSEETDRHATTQGDERHAEYGSWRASHTLARDGVWFQRSPIRSWVPVRCLPKATVSCAAARPHRIPTTLGSGASTPQKTHGQNGIIGHSAALLLSWLCSPYKLFVQVEGLTAMVFTRVLSDEWTSEKRKVDSSILSLTTHRLWSGSPGESHPEAPTDPGVNLSVHRAPVTLVTRLAGPKVSKPSARKCAGAFG